MGIQSLFQEYLNLKATDLENEVFSLAKKYNRMRSSYIYIMASDMDGSTAFKGADTGLGMSDYHVLHEMLRHCDSENIDIYLETPGGSGEAAEEIVRFLHNKFEIVNFVIAAEAKSAGTLMTLSADEIYMTDSGSLGPVDAQVRIGRSIVSAFDYVEWVERMRAEAQEKAGHLNPVDATMIGQITPGEFEGVFHAQEFAKERLKEWLPKYKFKHWNKTETSGKTVTKDMKDIRAEEIADNLINREKWRSHGRSLKKDDLEEIGLRIKSLEEEQEICEVIYRIKTALRLLFASSSHYKAYVSADERLFKDATKSSLGQGMMIPAVGHPSHKCNGEKELTLRIECPRCKRTYDMTPPNIKVQNSSKDIHSHAMPFPKDNKLICQCGYKFDLLPLRNNWEKMRKEKL